MIFDQYSRYQAVAAACKALIHSNSLRANAGIADIGSGPYTLLGNFLTTNPIIYLDPLLKGMTPITDREKFMPIDIFGDINELASEKKDIVVSVDTLEHIPPNKRLEFLQKLLSVSKSGIVISYPCKDSPDSSEVDNYVNNFFKNTFGENYPWLAEHFEYGLPSTIETKKFFEDNGLIVKTFKQGNCKWLTQLLPIVLALNEFDFLQKNIEEQSDYFNKFLAPFDIGDIGYRTVLVASKNETDISSIFPKNRPDESILNENIAKISSNLITQSLFPALSHLRALNKKVVEIEKISVEMGEWGISLKNHIEELEKKLVTSSQNISTTDL